MYKNQLQELAQRSCFNLPSYACYREGPDHAPRFRASVNFNGEIFESPNYWSTLRQAEHAAAEVALNALSSRCPSRSITARVLDETGVYKNLLQETAHRAGLNLPVYTTVRSGPGHLPVFTCTVNIASMNFTGVSAKTKKQAEKNAAIAAWSGLKRMPYLCSSLSQTNKETGTLEEEDQAVVSRVLSSFKVKDESKLVRRWDQNRGRRRLVKGGHKDWDQNQNSFASPSTSTNNNSLHFQLTTRPVVDLFMDSSTQKQSSFLTSLPPPPPRTTSKILSPPISSREIAPPLYQSNRPVPELVRVTSQAKLEERPPPLILMEEHQRDEEEWLGGGKTDMLLLKNTIEKEGTTSNSNLTTASYGSTSSIYRLFPLLNVGKPDVCVSNNGSSSQEDGQQTQIRSRLIGPPKPSSMAAAPIKLPTNVHMTRPSSYSGGFNFNPQRIAPAVLIRSVIPVCAAPPPPSSNPPPPPILQEASPSTSASVVPTQTGPDQESLISSNFNKLQF